MRITVCLLFVLLFQAKVEVSYSQSARISLSMQNATVEEVLNAIEESSEFYFLYNSKLVDVDRVVDVKEKNQPIGSVLNKVFDGSEVSYRVEDRQIILSNRRDMPSVAAPQQSNRISGVVKDKRGETIIGANVVVKGTTTGTITDFDGNFTIDAPANATLIVTYIGYASQEVTVAGKSNLNIILDEDTQLLNEVVVVGYGTQKKGEITSSVTSVKAADFNKAPVVNPMQLVEGRVAGLTISRPTGDPNAAPNIQMRGASSLKGNNEPLIIIDGIPGNMSSLNAIAPEDIEAMDVLKDGSAAAIYGTRGNNGVIIVTTKRPLVGVSQVDYSGYIMHETIAARPDILSAEEFAAYGRQTGNEEKVIDFGGREDIYDKLLNKSNFTHVHNLTATGGSAKMNYRASLNYRRNEGIAMKTDRETINGSIMVNHRSLEDKLLLSFHMSNSYTKANYLASDEKRTGDDKYNDYDVFYQATRMNPTLPIYNEDGSYYENYGGYEEWNPIAKLKQQTRTSESKNLLNSFKATYEIMTGLQVSGFFALEKNDKVFNYYRSNKSYSAIKNGDGGEAFNRYLNNTNKTMEWTANYNTSINLHNLTGLLGYSYQDFTEEYFAQVNNNFLTDAFGPYNMEGGSYLKQGLAKMESHKDYSKLIAFFARFNYNYDGKYMASASIRHEGSTKFGANNKWAWFPSVSAGWMISREEFMEAIDALDILKFRVGYGITGSLPNDPYMSLVKYGTGAGIWDSFNNKWLTATYGPKNNPNPDLRWEKNKSLNIGFDYGFFNNRLNGSLDWYVRTTKDLISEYTAQQPPLIHDKIMTNVGTMRNTGLELAVNAEIVQTSNFSYTANFTFSYEKNKLTSLSNEMYQTSYEDRYDLPSPGNPGKAFRLQEGHPVGSFYGYICDGIDSEGRYILRDLDGIPGLNADDRTFIGNGLPKYKMGLQNTFTYKNFDFSFFLRGMFGFDVLNEGKLYFGTSYTLDDLGRNVYKYALDNKTTESPLFSSYFVEKGNFLKIDNLTLGYTFNFQENKYIRNFRIYGNVTNVATITGYSGLTPDVNVTGLDAGLDKRGMYPSTRTFTLGVNVGF
ncbi:MAG: TonB-dependent receptor [Tannerellaceae bacterium]|nr:TonB-dependent receptor [Tannerellaceae bacterium]